MIWRFVSFSPWLLFIPREVPLPLPAPGVLRGINFPWQQEGGKQGKKSRNCSARMEVREAEQPPGRDLGRDSWHPAPLAARQEPHNARALPDNASSINPKSRGRAHSGMLRPLPALCCAGARLGAFPPPAEPRERGDAPGWPRAAGSALPLCREQGALTGNSAFHLRLLLRNPRGRNTRTNPGKTVPKHEEPPRPPPSLHRPEGNPSEKEVAPSAPTGILPRGPAAAARSRVLFPNSARTATPRNFWEAPEPAVHGNVKLWNGSNSLKRK